LLYGLADQRRQLRIVKTLQPVRCYRLFRAVMRECKRQRRLVGFRRKRGGRSCREQVQAAQKDEKPYFGSCAEKVGWRDVHSRSF
jgi:hypothetical protein